MKILALLFITGCCATEDLTGSSFVFSKFSRTSRVVLKPTVTKPLGNLTVCLQSYTEKAQRDSLFKLVSDNSMPQFHVYQIAEYYYISIGREMFSYIAGKEDMAWRLICVSWESSTGLIHFVVNGKLFPRRVLQPGFIIEPNFTAVLGHDLASVGITVYSGEPSYVGEISEVHMWDYTFPPSELKNLYVSMCSYCNGNIISWKFVDYEVIGDIFLYRPKL